MSAKRGRRASSRVSPSHRPRWVWYGLAGAVAVIALVVVVAVLQMPKSGAQVGKDAPAFVLRAASGGTASLSGLLEGKQGLVVVFYRGVF
jgi:hypothetical protein